MTEIIISAPPTHKYILISITRNLLARVSEQNLHLW